MYRLGYLELIRYQEILTYPILLLIVMVSVWVCNIYTRKSFDKILKDFWDDKLDGLETRILKLKKFYSVFISISGNANSYFGYNYLCYINAIVELKNGNEEGFFAELEKCKKKKEFPLRPCILALYYLSKEDKENAVKYYEEYIICENKTKELNVVVVNMFENDGSPEIEQAYNEWKRNIQSSVVRELADNIKQTYDEGDDIKNHMENVTSQKKTETGRRWVVLSVLLLILYFQFGKLPWDIWLSTYLTPEEAYEDIYPDNTLQLKLEGKDSCLLIGSDSSEHNHLLVKEKNDKWIVEMDSDIKVTEGHQGMVFYYYYQYDRTDCYLVTRDLEVEEIAVFDSCESEFTQINSEKATVGRMYCAYIEGYSEDYWVSINGTRVTFEEK